MEGIKKNIWHMQKNLNHMLQGGDTTGRFHSRVVYNLSLKLDKEIVKYYKTTALR